MNMPLLWQSFNRSSAGAALTFVAARMQFVLGPVAGPAATYFWKMRRQLPVPAIPMDDEERQEYSEMYGISEDDWPHAAWSDCGSADEADASDADSNDAGSTQTPRPRGTGSSAGVTGKLSNQLEDGFDPKRSQVARGRMHGPRFVNPVAWSAQPPHTSRSRAGFLQPWNLLRELKELPCMKR